MNTPTCKICGHNTLFAFSALVLHKYSVQYYQCQHCNFLQTEEPYWLEEAYAQPINQFDTGVLARNIEFSTIVATILYFLFDSKRAFLDYGGGYGIFTRLMRDIGFDFYHYDPLAQNLFAQGFEAKEISKNYELVTAFECFEHFVKPREEMEKLLSFSSSVLFSTELLPPSLPDTRWWYYAFDHGQHIAFYSQKTLAYLAEQYSMHFISFGHFHLFTTKEINSFLARLIVKNRHRGLYWFVKKMMTSKTFSDFNTLRQ